MDVGKHMVGHNYAPDMHFDDEHIGVCMTVGMMLLASLLQSNLLCCKIGYTFFCPFPFP